jgi:DUF4097 and DUF4098 domain-containing protein YvlB
MIWTAALTAAAAAPAWGGQPVEQRSERHIEQQVEQHVEREVRRAVARATAVAIQQNRDAGNQETERFSRRIRLGASGRFSIDNVSGEIAIAGGSGDEVSIDAVKRTRGDRAELATVRIEIDEGPGRVEVRTEYDRQRNRRDRDDHVSVDYTITVPEGTTVDASSVSGSVRVTNVRGAVRVESVSGDVTTSGSPRVEMAKSLSGDVVLAGATAEGDLNASSVSGEVRANGVRARSLQVSSVSGGVELTDVRCERLEAHTVSGDVEYAGTLVRGGRYDIQSHSGEIRLALAGDTGFELTANSFSGSVRSDVPVTLSGQTGRRGRSGWNRQAVRGVSGDGSAILTLRTFSGDIELNRR